MLMKRIRQSARTGCRASGFFCFYNFLKFITVIYYGLQILFYSIDLFSIITSKSSLFFDVDPIVSLHSPGIRLYNRPEDFFGFTAFNFMRFPFSLFLCMKLIYVVFHSLDIRTFRINILNCGAETSNINEDKLIIESIFSDLMII